MRHQDLHVDGQQVQTLYNWFVRDRFRVNRRYQRKLVWSIDEKRQLIDSIVNGLPIPLILLASSHNGEKLEIIDGLQRLAAIFDFLENKYALDDGYFDLQTLADTKDRADRRIITQETSKLPRETCLRLANYKVPISVFSAAEERDVENVFRRINANGRKLSNQEIRHAGSLGSVADVVRKAAASIRGDDLPEDVVSLRDIARVSLGGQGFGSYGIDIDDVFWVRHRILGRDQLRASKDEELLLDVTADILLPEIGPSGPRYRDRYYRIDTPSSIDDAEELDEHASAGRRLSDEIEKMGTREVCRLLKRSIDLLDEGLKESGVTLRHHIGGPRRNPIPRYFHAILVAIASRLKAGSMVDDPSKLVASLENIGVALGNVMGRGGGDWSAAEKKKCIKLVSDAIAPVFRDMSDNETIPLFNRDSYVRCILRSAISEESAVELKLGFTNLKSPRGNPDAKLIRDIVKHATAIANRGPDARNGYIIVGIADTADDAQAAERFLGVRALQEDNFHIVGTDHDIEAVRGGYDEFRRRLRTAMRKAPTDPSFIDELARRLTSARIQTKTVWVFEIAGSNTPVLFDEDYFQRIGASTEKVPQRDMFTFMSRFGLLRGRAS